ncbi:uncharacterized protein LOC123879520 [Maniola jurtina]|uniref:uncharacterized protein LOC123879520 n=1 Tax=Maniola jurtina TaxID=191418 RepID=UPI001E68F975|nr:uncharacterized protein LOC123879520 [Maniola jurtina]
MALTIGFFLVALVCAARCSPLGETTVCESVPNVLPNLGGLGVGPLGLNLPPSLLMQLLSQTLVPSIAPALGSTTICDSKPNIGLPVISPYGLPLNTGLGTNTVCESMPNLGLPLLQNYGLPIAGQTSICESTPNLSPLNLPLPYGLNLPGLLNNLPGSTTVIESTPNMSPMNLPLPYGLNLPGLLNNLPGSTTVIENTPNSISPLGLPFGLPGMGLAGLGLPYSIQLGGLGLPFNGGLPLNGLGRFPISPFGLPMI